MLFLRRSPLPVFGFDGETLLSGSHIKDTRTQCFIRWAGQHRRCGVIAHRLPRHNHRGCPDELFQARQYNRQAFVVDLFGIGRNQKDILRQGLSEGVRKGFKPKGVWFKPTL